MALRKRSNHRYGDSQADLRVEVRLYSEVNGYPAEHFVDASCACAGTRFRLSLDDEEGAATRTCVGCGASHDIGDSEEFLETATLQECACPCGGEEFEITAGVALHADSEDVRWLYLGCRCPACSLVAVYGDWKNEFEGYRALLARI